MTWHTLLETPGVETVLEATELQETETETLGCLQGQPGSPKGCSPAWVPQHPPPPPAAQPPPRPPTRPRRNPRDPSYNIENFRLQN